MMIANNWIDYPATLRCLEEIHLNRAYFRHSNWNFLKNATYCKKT